MPIAYLIRYAITNLVVGGRAPHPSGKVRKEVRLMRSYEVITIVLSIIKLIIELVKLCIEHKKSRPEQHK